MDLGSALDALAQQMVAAAAGYDPDGMLVWGQDMSSLQPVLTDVAAALRAVEAGADRLPVDPAVKAMLAALTGLQVECAAAAGDIASAFRMVHAVELARLENPRRGEHQWDTGAQAGDTTGGRPAATGRPVGERQEEAVLTVVVARLEDKAQGQRYDTTAVLDLDVDPGWDAPTRQAVSRSLRLYRSGLYRAIATYLRHDGTGPAPRLAPVRESLEAPPVQEAMDEHVARIDAVMDAAALPAPVVVWRGVQDVVQVLGERWGPDMIGVEWVEASYPSTSADPAVARRFASFDEDDVLLRLHVPSGIGAIRLAGWATDQDPDREAELLLARGLRMRVVADQVQPVGRSSTVWRDGTATTYPPPRRRVLDVQVLPPAQA